MNLSLNGACFSVFNKLFRKFNKLKSEYYISLADNELSLIGNICSSISNNLNTKVIYCNFTENDNRIFGLAGYK